MSFRSKGSSSPRRPGFIPDIVSGTDSRWIPAFAGTRQLVLHQTNIEAKAMLRTRFKAHDAWLHPDIAIKRSEEHTSELQSLMRISYAVFCLKKNTTT